MPENERFKEWFNSPYYQKLYFNSGGDELKTFLPKLCSHIGIKSNAKILDAACGTGMNAITLANSGQVTGVDISPENINQALQHSSESTQFFLHDLRLPFWGNYFDYIFILSSNFGFYRTRREHDAATRTISRALKPNGFFVLDYLNVHFTEDNLKPFESKTIDDVKFEIEHSQDNDNFYRKIKIIDAAMPEPVEFIEQKAKFSFGDVTDMMSFQGLQVREVFGNYDLAPYDVKASPRMIIIAEKARVDGEDKEKRLYSDGRKTDALT